MGFHILDILSVAIIGLITIFFVIKSIIKTANNKCETICMGCSNSGSCSTKNFSVEAIQSKPIKFYN
ncbi:MAG TPA: hypothetical protein PKD00_06215 [Burkholderiales bacterium]|nr:hypothetical protein [Burkholderiales bacterium]